MSLVSTAITANPRLYPRIQGIGSLTAVGDATVPAPGEGKFTRIQNISISISTARANSIIALEHGLGGDRLWEIKIGDDGYCGSYQINFGDAGLVLNENTILNLTIEDADSTVYVVAMGYVTLIQ